MGLWDSKDQRLQLLKELVEIPSVTGGQAEFDFPYALIEKLNKLQHFIENPNHLQLHPVGDGRHVVTALVKSSPATRQTVILLSHFDVVDVQDYGSLKEQAFRAEELTTELQKLESLLPEDVRQETASEEWLFGRGTMDMKCGLVLHMALLEQASNQAWDGNILLVTVPDEEVNSAGMRTAVPRLLTLAREHQLDYKLLLNSEPMFGRYAGDTGNYVYSGSIGKVLPGFLCYGKETHVGEPWSGLNGNYMASVLSTEMELNPDLCEEIDGELTPPPTNLIQKGLKDDYSAQIPHRAVALYNMFLYKKTMNQVVETLLGATRQATTRMEAEYERRAAFFANYYGTAKGEVTVSVLTYAELYEYAIETYGEDEVKTALEMALHNFDMRDERDTTITVVNQLATLCRERAPMVVLFFAPPYYPAVNSAHHPMIGRLVKELQDRAEHDYGMEVQHQHYFGGISDLSFVGLRDDLSSLQPYIANTPLWPQSYELPLTAMQQLDVPVLNFGPVGRDAHKWTERLNVNFSLGTLYDMLDNCLAVAFSDTEA